MPPSSASKIYISWIAWRNLTARGRKKSGLSFMTIVSVFGVAMGVAALIIVLSVMGGFEQDLKDKMLRGTPHLEVLSKRNALAGFSMKSFDDARFRQMFPEATDVEPYTQADVVLQQKKHMTSGNIFGVDPTRDAHLWGFGAAMTEGTLDAIGKLHTPTLGDLTVRRPGILLGEGLAEQLGAEIGDEITVLSPQANASTALGGGTVSRQYVVAGKFKTDLFNYDTKWAVVSIAEGRKFMPDYDPSLDADEYVTGFAINVRDPMAVQAAVDRVFGAGAGSDVPDGSVVASDLGKELDPLTWQKANKSLLFALKLEKFAMGSILMLIVVVAAFSISGTMMMTVFHRRGQVSLLRSLGMNRNDIARLYMMHGFTIGTIGILVGRGLGHGLGVCLLIKTHFGQIPLPAGVYHLKMLPCKWLWTDYAVIVTAAWLFSLGASIYPALTAARQDPGQGLRYL
jgi:lipoprotein-releasing system permease protein